VAIVKKKKSSAKSVAAGETKTKIGSQTGKKSGKGRKKPTRVNETGKHWGREEDTKPNCEKAAIAGEDDET